MKKRRIKKFTVGLLTFLLLSNSLAFSQASEDNGNNYPFSDIQNHWAKNRIIKKYEQKMVKGYPTGEFKPDNHLTRGELITLINRHFGLTSVSQDNYSDVQNEDWFKDEAAKAKYYDYIEDNKVRGKESATRLHVMTLLSGLMDIEKEDLNNNFNDMQGLTQDQQAIIGSFLELGYINGYEDGSFKPNEPINRAEMITITDRILGYIIKNQEDVKDIPEDATVTIIGNDITLEGKNIKSLYISPGATGNITVRDTIIEKELKIASEGKKSNVTLDNIKTKKVQIDPKSKGSDIIIKGKNNKIDILVVKSNANIKGADGDNIQVNDIIIKDSLPTFSNIKKKKDKDDNDDKPEDNIPPEIEGILTVSDEAITSLKLSWTKASDNRSAKSDLQYQVYYALNDNIRTIGAIEENGIPVGIYETDINAKTITGLTADTTYYFNIIVKDKAGNKSAYTSVGGTTHKVQDTISPTLTDNGLYPDNSASHNSIRIRWEKAADNETVQEKLVYRVYYSQSNNIRTVGAIERNGTPVGDYEADIQEKNITGLSPNTNYLFNVIVKDEAGNKTAYWCVMGTTLMIF